MSEDELVKLFGRPWFRVMESGDYAGWGIPDWVWVAHHTSEVAFPNGFSIMLHDENVDAFYRACERIIAHEVKTLDAYPVFWAYGLSIRRQRLRADTPMSLHSWGFAFDINPSANQVGTRGMTPDHWVEAFKAEGWEWGGDWEHYRDPMHFQRVPSTCQE